MPTTLITGANKGLGRETARRLVAEGHTVWMGARSEQRGRRAAAEVGGRFVALDVTDDASVKVAITTIAAAGGLDILINNAGIPDHEQGWPTADLEAARAVFDCNVLGVVRVTQACWNLLHASDRPVVVNVSSSLGSLARNADPDMPEANYPGLSYPASKAALNMLTVRLAHVFPEARVTTVNPGYTATDFTDNLGHQSVEEGAEAIVAAALTGRSGPSGQFLETAGPLPW